MRALTVALALGTLWFALTAASMTALAQDAPRPLTKPEMDMSRSVTLTGRELQALITAQVAQARAQEAAQAAQDVNRKVSEALTAAAQDAH